MISEKPTVGENEVKKDQNEEGDVVPQEEDKRTGIFIEDNDSIKLAEEKKKELEDRLKDPTAWRDSRN